MTITSHVEVMNDHFTKLHVHGLGVIHRFSDADGWDADPHDHPWDFESIIVRGGYSEQVFDITRPWDPPRLVHRKKGDILENKAETIHRIVELDGPVCWTLIDSGTPHIKSSFYRFEEGQVLKRFHDSNEWEVYMLWNLDSEEFKMPGSVES